jgi:hypothetical protein
MRIPGKPGLVHLILAAHTIEKVQMLFRSNRCVPERKVWYVPSLIRYVSDRCVATFWDRLTFCWLGRTVEANLNLGEVFSDWTRVVT